MIHLISNSRLHFHSQEVEFNPSQPLLLANGKSLRYSFSEILNFADQTIKLDLLCYHPETDTYLSLTELSREGMVLKMPNGSESIDITGMQVVDPSANVGIVASFTSDDPQLYSVNSLDSYRVDIIDKNGCRNKVVAFDLLLGKWLPMPMFEKDNDGLTFAAPEAWCRMRIDLIGKGSSAGCNRYRITWAFDTATAKDPMSNNRPYFFEFGPQEKDYALCNKVDQLLGFMSVAPNKHSYSDYIAALLDIDPNDTKASPRYRYIAFYIYLINYIRLAGYAPDVRLYNTPQDQEVDVDLVLDIGNSRTCGVLFEQSDFTKARMLQLRDLSSPWKSYADPFDMHMVFRRADFGNNIIIPEENIFEWQSFVRIGQEATSLMYSGVEDILNDGRMTDSSSPKRYLWDRKPSEKGWKFLVTENDPQIAMFTNNIYISGLSEQFDEQGNYVEQQSVAFANKYSRGSLMTFVMIEILQQSMHYINTEEFREKHGNKSARRRLRNIIVTAPTAMPVSEQIALRQSVVDAHKVLTKLYPTIATINIYPTPESLAVTDRYAENGLKEWKYDEASCCQLVYLYSEIASRYNGAVDKFFEMRGHVRSELVKEGYNQKALTVASIDIGAGTTDLMICSYESSGGATGRLTAIPKFWDSFYLAGDDIVKRLVQTFVIEGDRHNDCSMGCILSALTERLLHMTNDELWAMPCVVRPTVVQQSYTQKLDIIVNCEVQHERERLIEVFASNLLHDYFGADSANMSDADRRNRLNFNTQISVPVAKMLMDMLRCKRPARVITYDDIFVGLKPSTHVLDHFESHFGFRFEELRWKYDPERVADEVKSVLEPLLKQLTVILHAYRCDVLVLGGRPTSLDAVTELFIKYYPLSPNRLIRFNDYRVGRWYPFADGQGYFTDQKSVVAVGAMIGFLATHGDFQGVSLNLSRMVKEMSSTANYLGVYSSKNRQVREVFITPEINSASNITVGAFPMYIGCKQLNNPIYQARPLYVINNKGCTQLPIKITLSRDISEDKECLHIEDATDAMGNTLGKNVLEMVQQSIADDGRYWLDSGEFELSLK